MRGLLLLPLFALYAAVAAHPYPNYLSTDERVRYQSHPARRTHMHITFPRSIRYFAQSDVDRHTAHRISSSHHSHTNSSETDAQTPSHLRVPHSPLPATIGGGRTLPSSAFYALKFTLSTNSSQRNATSRNSTVAIQPSDHSPVAAAHEAINNTSQKMLRSARTEARATSSLSQKADNIFSALGLKGLHQLMSSVTSAKPMNTTNVSQTDEHRVSQPGASTERSDKVSLAGNNVSVKLAHNLTLSDVLEMIMSAAQNETDKLTAESSAHNETVVSGNASQVVSNNASPAQNQTNVEESSRNKSEMNVSKHNATDEHSNNSYVLANQVPHEAYEIIHQLHVLVHLTNDSASQKGNASRGKRMNKRIARTKQPEELLQLTKRYVLNLYRSMFARATNAEHVRANSSVVLKSLTEGGRLSEGVEGVESDDGEEFEGGGEGTDNEWGEKQDTRTQSTASPSAQVSAAGDGEWGQKQESQSEATPTASATVSPSESDGHASAGDEQGSASGEAGAAWSSPSATAAVATVGASSAEGAERSGDEERESEMTNVWPFAVASPGATASATASASASASAEGDTENGSSSGGAVSVPPMAVPMNLESDTSYSRPEKNYAVRNGENVTQLADMVYKLVREEGIFSIAVAPCDEVTDWMPDVVRRLREQLVELQFYCVDTRVPRQDMGALRQVFGDVATDFVQIGADSVKEGMPAELDLVVSWKGLQRWGMERGWRFLRGLRERGTKFVLVSNNAGIANMEDGELGVNVRNSPLLFGEPRRVIGDVTTDNSVQLLLYAMDDIRDGF